MPRASINPALKIDALREASWTRAVITAMMLIAFLLQIIVVQTHVHFPSPKAADIGHTASGVPSETLHNGKKTGDAHPAHCPWCHAFLSSGNYLPSPALPVALPDAFGLLDRIVQRTHIAASVFSHAWQSRAPPA